MRLLSLLIAVPLAGCAGNVADYIGSRSAIISPQLIRYGLNLEQSRCVGQKLADTLTPLQLRRFQRVAAALREGWTEPGRLTLSDLKHVAESMPDRQVHAALVQATEACGVIVQIPLPETPATEPQPQPTGARPAAWLNLGAAPTGQSIAVDAASLEEEGATRTAWFRLTNPGESAPTGIAYRLRIDCRARTIAQLENRRENGTASEAAPTPGPQAEPPVAVEGGTVMEIAWLALCT